MDRDSVIYLVTEGESPLLRGWFLGQFKDEMKGDTPPTLWPVGPKIMPTVLKEERSVARCKALRSTHAGKPSSTLTASKWAIPRTNPEPGPWTMPATLCATKRTKSCIPWSSEKSTVWYRINGHWMKTRAWPLWVWAHSGHLWSHDSGGPIHEWRSGLYLDDSKPKGRRSTRVGQTFPLVTLGLGLALKKVRLVGKGVHDIFLSTSSWLTSDSVDDVTSHSGDLFPGELVTWPNGYQVVIATILKFDWQAMSRHLTFFLDADWQ